MNNKTATSTMFTNLENNSNFKLNTQPYTWATIDTFFEEKTAQRLESEWPTLHFSHSASQKSHYNLWDRSIVERGQLETIEDMTETWKKLFYDFLSPAYKNTMEKMIGIDLSNTELKIRLCKYEGECWMSPHTDQKSRVVTQIIYLTEGWEKEWGGNLLILNSVEPYSVARQVPPMFNTSVLFRRSDNSFHEVQNVNNLAKYPRKSILVQFVDYTQA